jgi:hypothetical protein
MTMIRMKLVAIAVFAAGVGVILFPSAQAQPPAPPPKLAPLPAQPSVVKAPAFTLPDVSNPLTVQYCKFGVMMGGKYYLGLMDLPDTARPKLQWGVKDGNPQPQTIHVVFTFTYKGCDLDVPVDMTLGKDKLYTTAATKDVSTTWNLELSYRLFLQLNPFGPFTDDTNPLNPKDPKMPILVLKSITVTSKDQNVKFDPPTAKVDPLPNPSWPTFTCKICDATAKPAPVIPGVPAPPSK